MKSGTDRTTIYAHLYKRDDFPLRKDLLPSFDALFYEPFYQLIRQQLLAHEMERDHELGADVVSLLHIAPAHNREFQGVTSPTLENIGGSVTEIWKKLQRYQGRFLSVSTEEMFGSFPSDDFPEMANWWEYITSRYSWVNS